MNARLTRALGASALAAGLTLLILTWVMQLWRADLTVPFAYRKDALWGGAVIKGTIESGWYLQNDRLGAPLGSDMRDYPSADNFHWLGLRFISLFVRDWAAAMNLFFLLTFPLAAIGALVAFRQLGISYRWAIVGGILFAFLPYHFARGEFHLFLSAYYLVPLAAMLALWVYRHADLLAPSSEKGRGILPGSPRGGAAILVCLAVGSAGVYYAMFAVFFFLVAGALGTCWHRDRRHLGVAVRLGLVIAASMFVNVLPKVAVRFEQGPNPEAVQRAPMEVEWFGLKLSQMLLPVTGHRLQPLARLKESYSRNAPLVTENDSAALGVVAGLGLVILLGRLLLRPEDTGGPAPPHVLGVLTAGAFLLAGIGGISSLLYLTVLPGLRSYNRISVFIAFFALLAVLQLLDRASRRLAQPASSGLGRALAAAAPAVVLAVGILDQTSAQCVPPYEGLRAAFTADARFLQRVEGSVAPGSMVFQLPYLTFPENGGVHGMRDYDPFVGYLHSDTLRWSYGAMQGRECDTWQRRASALPLPEMIDHLRKVGFNGLMVDRLGYLDKGAAVERELRALTGAEPLVSENGRLAFYRLAGGQ